MQKIVYLLIQCHFARSGQKLGQITDQPDQLISKSADQVKKYVKKLYLTLVKK